MKRSWLLVGALGLALGLVIAGCANEPAEPNVTTDSPPEGTVSASAEVTTGVTVSVELTSSMLPAGSGCVATVSIMNASGRTIGISGFGGGIWIMDSEGVVIQEPRRIRHPISYNPLTPFRSRSSSESFTVPPPGEYTIQGGWGVENVDETRSEPLRFTSVER